MPALPLPYIAYANAWYHKARWNLASSNVPAHPLHELASATPAARMETYQTVLAEEASAALAARYRLPAEHVTVAAGTSGANFLFFGALAQGRRRKVAVETPGYEPLWRTPSIFGLEVVTFGRTEGGERPFGLDVEAVLEVVDEEVGAVVLTNPHNPTGRLLAPETLEALVEALQARGVLLYVDEVYLDFAGSLGEPSAVHLGDNVVVGSSLTKVYGLGGLRVGWLAGPRAFIETARWLQVHAIGQHSGPSLALGLTALEQLEAIKAARCGHLEGRAERLAEVLDGCPGGRWNPPDVGIVGALELAGVEDDLAFAQRLLAEQDLVVAPGTFFGLPGHVRVGFGAAPGQFEPALERLAAALSREAR